MHLADICIYPLKSARGTTKKEAVVEHHGLRGDRRWMLVDRDGVFLSQRSHPQLAQVKTRLSGGCLEVSAPKMPTLDIREPEPDARRENVRIWNDTVDASFAPPEVSEWFSAFLDSQVRLVFMDDPAARPVDSSFAVGDDFVSFADGYPLLLTSASSLVDLNRRLDDPVPMNRFRPNVVVDGALAFAEDNWRRIRIGAVRFHVAKPCARCVVTTTDQKTGAKGKEPLKTLATFRTRDGKVHFGQNLIPLDRGTIIAGDPVEVLE